MAVYKLEVWKRGKWVVTHGAAHMDELIETANAVVGRYRITKNGKVIAEIGR